MILIPEPRHSCDLSVLNVGLLYSVFRTSSRYFLHLDKRKYQDKKKYQEMYLLNQFELSVTLLYNLRFLFTNIRIGDLKAAR